MTHYFVYDVFTDTAFGGNQLAVFTDARKIPEHHLQSIAAEFNFSEVTFVYPPQDPGNTARVRIFTPNSELDFAGHPTIGTIYALAELGHGSPMVLELGVGPLGCTIGADGASFTTFVPLDIIAKPEAALVAQCLGLPASAIETGTHAPMQASLGLPFVIIELTGRDVLAACNPNVEVIRAATIKYPAGGDFAIFAYIRDGNTITSRMFAPLDNIPEDPATGSASATLAALLTHILGAPQNLVLNQGEYMNRPSQIFANTAHDPISVTLSGKAIKTMEGNFIIPA